MKMHISGLLSSLLHFYFQTNQILPEHISVLLYFAEHNKQQPASGNKKLLRDLTYF